MSIETSSDVRGWFWERLTDALERRRLGASEITRAYLVELLASFARDGSAVALERPLALQLADAVEAEGRERIRLLRIMGDTALYVLGFFEDHVERRGIDRSYVVTMGGHAYSRAEALAAYAPSEAARRPVYGELAEGFEDYVEAIDDVRESTTLRTPQDIVRLYDKWKRTGSRKVAERLRKEGVFPVIEAEDAGLLH